MKKKYKVCVYAISKNEEQHVKRWVQSMKEADDIYVLDTGSTDSTVELLKEEGCLVKVETINPWRFDIARNLSLDMVPKNTDICVCTDLDEVFEPGWRKKLEEAWEKGTTRLRYQFYWSVNDDGSPRVFFYLDKIHTRKDYCWKHPVHEVLYYIGNEKENFSTSDSILLKHFPDQTKSRSSYLPLLELSVKEDPEDDRNMHYLGREYMYYKNFDKAIETLLKHLSLKKATWKSERSASMRYISRCYQELNRPIEAEMWLNKAIEESPYLREPCVELAFLLFQQERYKEVIKYCGMALSINDLEVSYINEPFCWDSTIDDLLSVSYYRLGNLNQALLHAREAYSKSPSDERLRLNLELMEKETSSKN